MTRFAGVVGYGESQEVPPGSGDWKDVVVEKQYFGRVVRNSRRITAEDKVTTDLVLQNSIDIVADPYARDNIQRVLYVQWRGSRWKVDEITEQHPRLLLRLGNIYSGPVPEVPDDSP